MSEIELVLDGMRKTGECVSELEAVLGVRSTPEPPARDHRRRHASAPPCRVSLFQRIRQHIKPVSSGPRFDPMITERLREKELFLEETRKQLYLLERSIDEMTKALHDRRPSLRYESDLWMDDDRR